MKTAISLADDLFHAVNQLAHQEHLSRSEIFARAVKEYLDRQQNRQTLEILNQVYQKTETREEQKLRKQRKRYYAARLSRSHGK
jgi:metal-responsive CopG/Arc/MetJ family transcriptional regulator